MKILWLGHFPPYPPKGGMMLRSYHMLVELAKEFDIHLVSPIRRDVLQGMYSDVAEGLADCSEKLGQICQEVNLVEAGIGDRKSRKVLVALNSLLNGDSYSVAWFRSASMNEAVTKVLSQGNYEIIHCDTISMLQYIPENCRTPVVVNNHNIESDMLRIRGNKENRSIVRWYFHVEADRMEAYERARAGRASLHLTCSEEDSTRLLSIVAGLCTVVVPNGVDTSYFQPLEITDSEDSLIFVGGQSWYPNRDAMEFFATQVWPGLVAKRPELRFDLIGKNPSAIVRDLGLQDTRFRVHGFVDDIRPLVGKAKIFVCPIRDGGGTKLKILDAMAMGKAIVAHPLSVDGIDVTDGKHVLLAESAEQFRDSCLRLLDDQELRGTLEEEGRRLVEQNYSSKLVGQKIRELYRCL